MYERESRLAPSTFHTVSPRWLSLNEAPRVTASNAEFHEASLTGQDQLDLTRSTYFTSSAAAHDTHQNQPEIDAEMDISQPIGEEVVEHESGCQESVAKEELAYNTLEYQQTEGLADDRMDKDLNECSVNAKRLTKFTPTYQLSVTCQSRSKLSRTSTLRLIRELSRQQQ